MPTMKRKEAIAAVRAAGYHNDSIAGLHAYIHARMSLATYTRELQLGRDDRAEGKPCPCTICTMSDAAEVAADFTDAAFTDEAFARPNGTPQGVQTQVSDGGIQ